MIEDQTSSSELLVSPLREKFPLWFWWWNFMHRWWHYKLNGPTDFDNVTGGGIVALQLLYKGLEVSLLWLHGLSALVSHSLLFWRQLAQHVQVLQEHLGSFLLLLF